MSWKEVRTGSLGRAESFVVALLISAVSAPSLLLAQDHPASLVAVRDHLQFLGYSASFDEDGDVSATHDEHWNLYVKEYQGGLLMTAIIDIEAKPARLSDCFRLANSINTDARLIRAYINSSRNLVLEAWMPGDYDKTRFGVYLEAWQDDGGLLGAHDDDAVGCRGE